MTSTNKNSNKILLRKILNKRSFSARAVYCLTIAFCAIVHAIYIVIFARLEISIMVIFNYFSVGLYISLLLCLLKKKYVFVVFASYVEICIHSTMATLSIGWEFGFPLQIFSLIPLAFFCPFKNRYPAYIYSGLSAVVFILLKIYSFGNVPLFDSQLIRDLKNPMYLFNSIISIIPAFMFSGMYSYITRNSQSKLHEKNKNLMYLANVDPLTGLLNRRSMVTKLEHAYEYCEKSGAKFALAICDIDDFKKINDEYGHDCGDYVLKTLSSIIINYLHNENAVCRWGGEEILILFPNAADSAIISEALRQKIEEYKFQYNNHQVNVTMTFGICSGDVKSSISEMLLHADRNLYTGKKGGKNRVVAD